MVKLSKDEWISLFNKFINESDSYGEAIGKVQQYGQLFFFDWKKC